MTTDHHGPRARMALRAHDLEREAIAEDSKSRADWLTRWALWLRIRAGLHPLLARESQASHIARRNAIRRNAEAGR